MDLNKIGLFGGTFDPVHAGHLIIAEWVLEELQLDHLFFIPAFLHPFHKRSDIAPAQKRLEMLQMALSGYKRFSADRVEIEREGVSYAVDTIRYFRKKYEGAELFYLIGGDNLADFERWKEPQAIKKLTNLVVYERGSAIVKAGNKDILIPQSPFIDISSTQIRRRIADGKSCRSLLPPGVYDYIIENGLYRPVTNKRSEH